MYFGCVTGHSLHTVDYDLPDEPNDVIKDQSNDRNLYVYKAAGRKDELLRTGKTLEVESSHNTYNNPRKEREPVVPAVSTDLTQVIRTRLNI